MKEGENRPKNVEQIKPGFTHKPLQNPTLVSEQWDTPASGLVPGLVNLSLALVVTDAMGS